MKRVLQSFLSCPRQRKFALISFGANIVSGFETALSTSILFNSMGVNNGHGLFTTYIGRDIILNLTSLSVINKWSSNFDNKPEKSLLYSQITHQCVILVDV